MSPQRSQSALGNIPRVVVRPTWDNVVAASYLIKGIVFFLLHPFLHPLLKARLLPAFLLSVFVYFNLFFWTLLPQVLFLKLFHTVGSAWVNAVFLVLGEGAAVVALLFESFLVDESQVDIFDAVLIYKGYEDLVRQYRPVTEDALNDPVRRLGKPTRSSVYAPFSFRQIAEFVMLLPVNFIPYVGVPVFLLLTGYRAGPFQHWRYFQLLGYDRKRRNAAIKSRRWQYTWYGTVYLFLQLVPPFSMFFLLTAPASSALWAAELERARREQEANLAQAPQAQYTDEPEAVV
ncbi:EI24 domain containing protein [Pyrenophora tritici-repentis]|uniref:EI24 domain containing protein n=2 Tax=Pyrenophora tritici-repentis TaxID=45151 RepID=A0A2W1G5P2_9PLEO|nr:uncharacterized protein PTRG_11563 [Pyrenophora tritici-repentis Pt-1C-BFP]KAA8627075.1 hypothetical protein PtrV1_02755 [Pyrenophora tritici-repentis]EDU44613.1 conserved hypothetical protein [Pyrenophora tritici-repentis Pt-1C-BFP]KAF7455506.1 hypothetical protein A1F99_027640 [Pyrenophora tritici-repentis]KAF7578712.1 EI24 domain containing protein [Pyrenophora tritici-repentis]KAG9389258.1 hypothetical protein A1F94_002151 [Pyrenophora tritici-repentis]